MQTAVFDVRTVNTQRDVWFKKNFKWPQVPTQNVTNGRGRLDEDQLSTNHLTRTKLAKDEQHDRISEEPTVSAGPTRRRTNLVQNN